MATAISIVLIIAALFMIVSVLLQSSEEGGISAIGQTNSYLSKSKAKTFEDKLALCTKIAAAVFVVLSLLMLIIK